MGCHFTMLEIRYHMISLWRYQQMIWGFHCKLQAINVWAKILFTVQIDVSTIY